MSISEIEDAEWEDVFDDSGTSQTLQPERGADVAQPGPQRAAELPRLDLKFWQGLPILAKAVLVGVPLLILGQCSTIESSNNETSSTSAKGGSSSAALPLAGSEDRASTKAIQSDVSIPLDVNGLAYAPAENGQCDGESWGNFTGTNGPELVWNPEYNGPETDYNITFHYRYDGTILHLSDGVKVYGTGSDRKQPVKDRDLVLTRDKRSWIMNGKRIYECAG
jgi:hypothetical protein